MTSPHEAAATGAVEWLLSKAIEAPGGGLGWPAAPGEQIEDVLYAGTPGVLLTMLDAYAATGDERFVDAASRAGRHLAQSAPRQERAGFYVGVAGIGFALRELSLVTDDAGDRANADAALDLVRDRALRHDGRARWGPITDIIVGDAGIGLWLLAEGDLELATAAGRMLVDGARPADEGRKWAMAPDYPRLMPNFSHGTAGIAYFLASLAQAGAGDEFLESARAGAAYLTSVARIDGGGFRVFHYEPGGEDAFPLGWCHGPTGTARLFERLRQVTGECEWEQTRDACARTVRTSGIPERKEPGFWDNVAACCGSTGVARFFLDLHRVTGDADHLAFAVTMSDDIVERATVDDAGTRWSNIEHRLPEPVLPPQCGALQGAAGIASWLFELDAFLSGDDRRRVWPDSPF